MNDEKHNGNGHDPDEKRTDNVIRIPTLAERDKMRREQEKQWRKDYKAANKAEPMINLPPVTKIMLIAIIGIHLALTLFTNEVQLYWVHEHFGFKPAYYTGDFPGWIALIVPFTYMFLHGGWMHLGMNAAMLAAFGAGIEQWMGGKRMVILFIACGLAACLFHFILSPFSQQTMIGASGGISGLFAAVLIMLQSQGRLGAGRYGILPFAALWVGLSFVFGLLGGPDGSPIAWAAHIGGFFAGLVFIRPVLKIR
ncbi:MAG: rhomboid family intramembrane serine protease [Rhodospirillales bacterium]|nr:rhomboid family intramembrane serine protease [Rhodospirillales bacterium]